MRIMHAWGKAFSLFDCTALNGREKCEKQVLAQQVCACARICMLWQEWGIYMKFSESLKSNRDFKNVYSRRKSFANKYIVMYVLENGLDKNRLGISVSKKVGNSVIRHRITRLVRESYRLHEDVFCCGLDIVVVARTSARDARYAEIESALLHVSRLHKILDGGQGDVI